MKQRLVFVSEHWEDMTFKCLLHIQSKPLIYQVRVKLVIMIYDIYIYISMLSHVYKVNSVLQNDS